MAFKASNLIPAKALDIIKSRVLNIKNYCEQRSAQFGSGASADQVLSIRSDLYKWKADLDSLKTTPGLAAYAADQENDQSYNVATEFVALLAAMDAVIANVDSTFPKDGGGYLLEKQFDGAGGYTFRQFSTGQLNTLRSLLDAVASQVE